MTSVACGEQGGVPSSTSLAGVGGTGPSPSTTVANSTASVSATGAGGQGGASDETGAGGAGGSETWMPVPTAFCGDGWLGLDERTCFYLPSQPNGELLVFLHGMLPPDGSPAGMQAIVRAEAEKRGAVALFPRGRKGLCSWSEEVSDWYCWPTSRANVDLHAAAIFGVLEQQQVQLEGLLGAPFEKRFLLGFSNGGYFATYAGLESWWPVSGVGVVAAGRSFVDTSLFPNLRPPFFIRVGELDQPSVKNSAQNLAYVLGQASWPHDFKVQQGKGHTLWPTDLEAAFASWD